jgi:hypothetical protein
MVMEVLARWVQSSVVVDVPIILSGSGWLLVATVVAGGG